MIEIREKKVKKALHEGYNYGFYYLPKEKCFVLELKEFLTHREISLRLQEVIRHLKDKPCHNILINISDVKGVSYAPQKGLDVTWVEFLEEHPLRCAIVMQPSYHFSRFRLTELLQRYNLKNYRLFSTNREAREWLLDC